MLLNNKLINKQIKWTEWTLVRLIFIIFNSIGNEIMNFIIGRNYANLVNGLNGNYIIYIIYNFW
jgi:hypothetical protein